jgi:hypothetical protein
MFWEVFIMHKTHLSFEDILKTLREEKLMFDNFSAVSFSPSKTLTEAFLADRSSWKIFDEDVKRLQ